MTTQIVIHLLPQEIDWFEWQIKQLKQGSYYLEEDDKVIIDVTLNLNLVDWEQSKLPKQLFIDKFNQLEKICNWCETQFIIDEEHKCLGCDDKRREAIRSTQADNILYLDSDLIFKPELLKYMMDSAKVTPNEYYIISPQISKWVITTTSNVVGWDDSWNCLVNKKYINKPTSQQHVILDPYLIISNIEENISISPISQFKFGGGWFNLLSTKLLKLTDMPDSFGPYGVDDLYVMVCCDIMKQKGYNVQQYILEGTIVTENIKYGWNPYSNLLYLINKKDEFRIQAESNLNKEIQNFINRI
jgi:hypothetical protein